MTILVSRTLNGKGVQVPIDLLLIAGEFCLTSGAKPLTSGVGTGLRRFHAEMIIQ